MVYRDSTDDGNPGDMLDTGFGSSDFTVEAEARRLADHLKFLTMLSRLWRLTAMRLVVTEEDPPSDEILQRLMQWGKKAETNRQGLLRLLDNV